MSGLRSIRLVGGPFTGTKLEMSVETPPLNIEVMGGNVAEGSAARYFYNRAYGEYLYNATLPMSLRVPGTMLKRREPKSVAA